jgi:sialate O-acetylesterase
MKATLTVLLLASLATLHAADLKVAAIFTDHAVLQRDVAVPVWGWADAGADVKVEFAGQTKTSTADATGKWFVKLDPLKASTEPTTLKVTVLASAASVALQDILVGEVWLGSGQSNMMMPVQVAQNFGQERSAANLPLVRMFKEESGPASTPQPDGKGEWRVCSPDTVGDFSATLFFFGREIHTSLSVPVGLIHSSIGGTSIEQWTAVEAQTAVKELAPIIAAAKMPSDAAANKTSLEQEVQLYKRQLANWEKTARQARAENKPAPPRPQDPVVLRGQLSGLGELFNGKIAPLIPYAIKGAIWYQGEGNAGADFAPLYRCQLSTLIQDWRTRWGNEFAFGFAQLANYSAAKARDWPALRESQLKTLALPKTGMGITIDIGEANNIHFKNKQEVGRRLSLWAMGAIYGQKVPAISGPLPAGSKITGDQVELSFIHTDGGLVAKGEELKGFVVAGADRQWKCATARIAGDKVIVTSAEVKAPLAVRYAWENAPTCNLYNGAGLPASPFRTDDWHSCNSFLGKERP